MPDTYRTTPVNVNRASNNIELPSELSGDIWAKAVEESAVMQLAQRVDLPGRGMSIPVVTGDVSAEWTAEATEKQVSDANFELKLMKPYKLAIIECFSDEFRRDLPALYNELARRLPSAIAKKFDATIFDGTAPGSGFDVLSDITNLIDISKNSDGNTYQKLVTAMGVIAASGSNMDGIALAPAGMGMLLAAVDNNGAPLFPVNMTTGGGLDEVLGARIVKANHAIHAETQMSVIGYAGDWMQARYGIVDGINIAISDQATINNGTSQINLWQSNMFAVRVEAEVGFVYSTEDAFCKLAVPSA